MNGLINTKADYQVCVKNNLGNIRVIMVVDKPSFTTWFASNGKNDHIASSGKIHEVLNASEMNHIKQLRTSDQLQPNQLYELTDVLAMNVQN